MPTHETLMSGLNFFGIASVRTEFVPLESTAALFDLLRARPYLMMSKA